MLGRRRCYEKHPVAAIMALLSLSCIVGTAAQIDKSNRELNDSANRIPWPVYQHSTASSALGLNPNRPQEDTKPRPRLSDSLLPPSFIKVINSVSSPDWETTTPAGPRAIFLTSSTTTTTTTTTTPSPPPASPPPPPPPSTTATALTSSTYIKRGHPPEVDPLSPSAWKAVPESPPFPKRSRLQTKRRRKLRPKQESTVKEHTLFTTEQATEASTTAHPTRKFGVTRRQLPPLVRGYRSKPTKSTPPTTTPPRRAYVRPALPGRKYTPAIPRRPVLATTTSTTSSSTSSSTTTTTTSTRRPFIFGERKVPSWYGQTSTSTTTTSTTRPLLSTPLARLGRRPSGLRYKPDDLSPGFGPRTKLSLRPLPPVIRDAVPQTVEKDELELSQSVQRPNGRRRLVNDVPARVHLVKGQLPDLPTPQITHNETEAIKPEGRQSGSDEGGEVVRFVAIPHFVDGNIPTRRADFKESSRGPFRRIFRNPFVVPVRRRFPYAGPVAVFPPSLSSVEDSSSQDEEVIRIPVERPESGAFPALQPPPALPLRVVRPAYPGAVGHQASAAMAPVPPTNNAEHESAFTQPRPPMTLGSANLPSRVSRPKPEEPRCDRFSEDICLDDFEYPTAAILDTISRQRSRFDTMYAEVRDRSPQVDGVTRKQEERYTMRHYFGGSERDGRPRDYAPDGGFLCPSEILYERPRRARNHLGVWKVIVNIGEYRQTMRLEKCLRPNRPCSYVLEKYQSSCSQVYSYQRLLTFEKGKGLHIDIFRVPSSCSCHVKGFSPFQRHDEPVTPVRQQPPFEYDRTAYTSATSLAAAKEPDNGGGRGNNTLWIILGNGKDLDPETKARLVQQLRQYPQLADQLSQGENVRELGNEADEYQRPYTRPEPTRTPSYGVHHYGSTHKTREERPQLLNAAPPRWSQGTVANEPFKYVQPNRIRRPPPQPQMPTDYEADDALPPGARPRYYQKPFKASEEDTLFTRSSGGTTFVVLRQIEPLSRRYQEPARERHPHVGQASQGSADVRLAHGPTAAPRGDVLLVEPVRQRPYGKRFQVVTTTEPSTTRDVAKKINYSYHPIIDYITR